MASISKHLYGTNITLPIELQNKAIEATEYLKGDHIDDFASPKARKKALDSFIEKINKYTPKNVKKENTTKSITNNETAIFKKLLTSYSKKVLMTLNQLLQVKTL